MTYNNFPTNNETKLVQVRYKVTTLQDQQLREIEARTKIPTSAIVRLALDTFLPKTKNISINNIDKALDEIFNK